MGHSFKGATKHAGIEQGRQCGACGTPMPMQYDYVDKHGNIKQLCAACYTLALEGGESPELASRDRRVAWILATIGAVLLLAWLTGCATRHTVEHRVVNGKKVVIHTDAPAEMEPPCKEPWAGCTSTLTNAIFLRSAYLRPGMKKHEIAHVEGMRHTGWVHHEFLNWKCATVTAAGGGYKVGQLICNRLDGEVVFTDASMKEIAA